MEPDIDVTLAHFLHQAIELTKCEAGCLALLDCEAASTDRIISGAIWNRSESESFRDWQKSFLRSEYYIQNQIRPAPDQWPVKITTRTDELEFLGKGFVGILELVKTKSFQIILALYSPSKLDNPDPACSLEALSGSCTLALDRFLMRRSIARAGYDFEFVGISDAFQKLEERVKRAAAVKNFSVLIMGERGAGKEHVARALHHYSSRRDASFIAVNCAALHHDLYAAELFGSRKGSFTGAAEDRAGKFRAAEGGTLFLDEITLIPPNVGVGLLRALDYGEIQSLGYDRPTRVNVRIIASTNANISQMVDQQRFPADLYDRLNVLPVQVPPLRDRKADIPLLVNYFFRKHCERYKSNSESSLCNKCLERAVVACLDSEIIPLMRSYSWPGNVRELRNAVIRLIAESQSDLISELTIRADRLPQCIFASALREADYVPADLRLSVAVAKHIEHVIKLKNGNKSAAARALGLPLSTLISKMKRLSSNPYYKSST